MIQFNKIFIQLENQGIVHHYVGLTHQLVDIERLARSLAGRAKSLGAKDGIPAASESLLVITSIFESLNNAGSVKVSNDMCSFT